MKRHIMALVAMMLALTASADVTIDNITYTLDATNMEASVNTSLSGQAFPGNTVTIPDSITSDGKKYAVVGVNKFTNTGKQMEMVLPKTLRYIKGIKSGVKTLNVPAGVTSITDMHESADLQDFVVDGDNDTYCAVDGVLFSKDKKTLVYLPFGRNSFQGNLGYTVPEGTEVIGASSFFKMTHLATLALPEGLQSIGQDAFNGCTALLSFAMPTGLKTIGPTAFYGCTGLQTLIFPEGLEEIGASAFDGCTGLTTVQFGEGLKAIRTYAFASCYALTYVSFPNSLETIEDRAFWRTILNKIDLPESLRAIGWQTFVWTNGSNEYSKHLQSLVIPAQVTQIGTQAFSGYYHNWGDTGSEAARFSVDTLYVHMPPYVVPSNAFGNRSSNTLVVPRGMRDIYATTDGWRNSPNVIEGDWDPEYDTSPFVVGNTSIDEGMSVTQGGITYRLYAQEGRKATLYSDLTNYPDDAINLPEAVYFRGNNYTLTGVEMFKSNRVVDLVLPATVTSIKGIKSGVKTLNVPAGVTSITDMHESADLQDFVVDGDNDTYCAVDGVLFSKDKKTLYYMPYGRKTQANMKVTIAEGVETIGDYAYYGMTNITRLETNASLREIGNRAFQGCTSIATLTFVEGLKKIGAYNFAGCTGLARLTFPQGVEEIGNNAFEGCSGLARVSFAEGLKTIRTYAFASCYALTKVEFPNSLETIEDRAFWRTILNEVELSESLQTIGWQTFVWTNGSNEYSKHLQSLVIPAQVTQIGAQAFSGYYHNWGDTGSEAARFSVDTLYSYIMEPMQISSNSFGNISQTVLVVPTGTKEDYLMFDGWKNFGDRIIESDDLLPSASKCAKPLFTRIGNILKITCDTEGATIYYTKDGKDPTINDKVYADSIILVENSVVKAIAVKEGLNDSETATYTVDWFTVADVQIALVNLQVEMATETEGAIIRYTMDGSDPTEESLVYQNKPLSVADKCTIKAIGMKPNWNNSRITTFEFDPTSVTCAKPVFRRSGKQLVIETATVDGIIYYTLDDTEPTENSILYETPITPTENGVVRAVVMKEGYRNSEVATYQVDWFAVTDVKIEMVNLQVEMTTETEGAVIRYTIDGSNPTEQSVIYSNPLSLPDSTVVKAFGMKTGLTNSSVTTYVVDYKPFTCPMPTFRMAGKQLVIETSMVGGVIYYTMDDTEPTEKSTVYDSPITPTENCTVRAVVMKEGYLKSETAVYQVDWFTVADVKIELVNLQVEMSTQTDGATIRYTIDGSDPTEQSAIYKNPLSLPDSTVVKAFAMKTGMHHSNITAFMVDLVPVTCAAPTFRLSGKQLIIETSTIGGEIFYTLDGTEPTKQSAKYEAPVMLTKNCMIKAVVTKDGYRNSEVGEYVVDGFVVANVQIELVNLQVEMTTETEGAVIRYTTDGNDPTEQSAIYRSPLSLPDSTVVKAFAMKQGHHNSGITTYKVDYAPVTCAAPTLRMSGKQLIIETSTIDGEIYYTLDETEPTKQSTRYDGPVTLTRNCMVKAVVMKEGYRNSPVVQYEASLFRVNEPTFAANGTTLTILCGTEGATIYYAIGEDAEPTKVYEQPIALQDNRTVRAMAKRDGYTDSPISEFKHSLVTCSPASLKKYDGLYFELEEAQEGTTLYYSLDQSEPAILYTGRMPIAGVCTLKTVAKHPYKNDSEVKSYELNYHFDGETATVAKAGLLHQTFEWIGEQNVNTLTVSGPLDASDLAFMRRLTALRHLDLQRASVAGRALPDSAFAGMNLVTFASPKDISSVGSGVFGGCQHLAAVIWNANERLTNETFGDSINPNMLCYVVNKVYAPTRVRNVIVNGSAQEIVLSDAEGNNNFYCPVAFTTKRVSYTHNFSMKTHVGICMGWETIVLPFAVQKVAHDTKGELMTFAQFEQAGSPESGKPFWLYELRDGIFEDAPQIEANTPYIISMPNSTDYAERYNLSGNVTFSAEGSVEIAASDSVVVGKKGGISLVPNYLRQAASNMLWAINRNMDYEGYPAGSLFVPNLREVRPFEAYATNSAVNAPLFLSIEQDFGGFGGSTGIYDVLYGYGPDGDETVNVYDLSGLLVKSGKRSEVMRRLTRGVYIINGRKHFVK